MLWRCRYNHDQAMCYLFQCYPWISYIFERYNQRWRRIYSEGVLIWNVSVPILRLYFGIVEEEIMTILNAYQMNQVICSLSWQGVPYWLWACGLWWRRVTTSVCSTPTSTPHPLTSSSPPAPWWSSPASSDAAPLWARWRVFWLWWGGVKNVYYPLY